MDDIVPELLDKIKADFFEQAEKNAELERLLLLVRSGKADFIDAHEFATKLGQILSEALQNNISGSILPDGKMHFNIASRILNETLGTNHKMVSTYAKQVQEVLNKEAGIGLKSIQAPINQERIDGLVNRLSYEEKFDDVSWILKEPIVNFNQNIVDNHIKVNADFHFKSGLKPKIVRTTDGNCCTWCSKLAGVYTYPGVNKDVFRRHDRCTCTVDYHPGDGKRQNVWTKKLTDLSHSGTNNVKDIEFDTSVYEHNLNGTVKIHRTVNHRLPDNAKPFEIIDVITKKGGISRTFHDGEGKRALRIDNSDHGQPKYHPMGAHKHIIEYDAYGLYIKDGKPIRLTVKDKFENGDIL